MHLPKIVFLLFSAGSLSEIPQIYKIPLSDVNRKSPVGFENLTMIDERTCLLGNTYGLLFFDLSALKEQLQSMQPDFFLHTCLSLE